MEENPIIYIPELGELHYDASMDWYEIEVPSRFGLVNICLEREEELSSDELATEIRSFCKSLDLILEKAFNEIVNTMVPLKNDCWLDEEETPISGEELLQAIQSKEISISLSEGGLAEMFFDDGNFFGGHSIVVWHSEDGVVDRVHLAG
jgi:hypothetical protein